VLPYVAAGILVVGGSAAFVALRYPQLWGRSSTTDTEVAAVDAGLKTAVSTRDPGTTAAGAVDAGAVGVAAGADAGVAAVAGAVDAGSLASTLDAGVRVAVATHPAGAPVPKLSALPGSIKEIFASADASLRAGNWGLAVQQARQAEGSNQLQALPGRERKLAQGYSSYIQTRAYCATKNYANWEDELNRVPRAWQGELETFCSRQGLTRSK
jgi:hypothetical protein